MTKRQNRMALVAMLVVGAIIAILLLFQALGSNTNYFFTPTEITQGKAPIGKSFRVGGLVVDGSLKRDGMKSNFDVTDKLNSVSVEYVGILPDLFREGQGIIATGSLVDGIFQAEPNGVLAKHDENYMPPEVADALEKAQQLK
ncbi:MAG: cytochrome c maturation protein CcmE [Gammaproteobacteria bacterium]